MSASFLQLVGKADAEDRHEDPAYPTQLCLFDFRPVYRVLCLPMGDMHGRVFVRALLRHRPSTVVDLRSHPYFDLHALGREVAFAVFNDTRAVYRHRPLNLLATAAHSDRWRLMSEAASFFDELAQPEPRPATFAFLLHRHAEVDLLAGAMNHAARGRAGWEVVLP